MSADLLGAFSQMLDDSYPATDARTAQQWRDEAIMWRRSMKGTEEAGEVTEAVLGLLGENPRKGQTHTLAEVITEHLDAAMAHLGAVEHLTGNKGEALDLLDDHVTDRYYRLAKAMAPAPAVTAVPAEPGDRGFLLDDEFAGLRAAALAARSPWAAAIPAGCRVHVVSNPNCNSCRAVPAEPNSED